MVSEIDYLFYCLLLIRSFTVQDPSQLLYGFWKKIENFWFMLSGKYVEFTLKDVFVGRQVGESDQLVNYLFILAKLHIWNCRKRRVPPNSMLDVKYRTEMYLASNNNKVKQFQAKWQF